MHKPGFWNAPKAKLNLRTMRLFMSLCLALLACAACRSIGPATVRQDRLDYATAVADSWKEQLLLNIVKTRYGDAPTFLEVASVVSGYSLETGVSINGQFSPRDLRGDTFYGGGISGKFTDRPTISYTPMTGEKFARSLMAPVPLDSLMFTIQGGVPVDFVLGLTAQSIEGHHNQGLHAGAFHQADPEFLQLIQLLRSLQQARVLEFEIVKQEDQSEVWLRFHPFNETQSLLQEQLLKTKALLGISSDLDRIRIVFGMVSPKADMIAIRTRSMMQILNTLGSGVQIPLEHLTAGGATVVDPSQVAGHFTVKSGKKKPDHVFAAVAYEGLWFWINWNDYDSKITLSAATVMFNFLEGSNNKISPVLTIPTN